MESKKKKIIKIIISSIILLLLCAIPVFAENGYTNDQVEQAIKLKGNWVNAPFMKLLYQFSGLESTWIRIARDIAIVMVVLNIIWNCIKIAFGTMEVRKAFVSNITRWFLFLVVMVFYPAMNSGLLMASQQIAKLVSGNWVNQLGSNLQNYYNTLYKTVQKNTTENALVVALKETKLQELNIQKGKELAKANQGGGVYQYVTARGDIRFRTTEQIEWYYNQQTEMVKNEIENAKNANTGDVSIQTFAILQSIFNAEKDGEGKCVGWNLILDTYFDKSYAAPVLEETTGGKKKFSDKHTKKTERISIVSPDAILKCVYLCSAIMWEREWDAVNKDWIANQEDNEGLMKYVSKKFSIIDFPFSRIWEILFCFFLIVTMVICCAVACIQYMMCMFEFLLVSGAGAILVPFMLFDGMQDMAQRLISTLFQQAMKMVFCVISMYFVCWCFMELTEQTVGAITGLSLQNFIFGVFISLIGGAFVTNAPKIAQALMSGTPQMSMGEVLQQGGSYLAARRLAKSGARSAARVVTQAGKLGREGVRKGARSGINGMGQMGRNFGAMAGAYKAAREAGIGKVAATGHAMAAGTRQSIKDNSQKFGDKVKGFVTGSKTGAGGGGGGAGNSTAGLNETGRKAASTEHKTGSMYVNTTAQAHNKNYGQSMHYEKGINGELVATRQQTIGEHLKTQNADAKKEHYERVKAYMEQKKAEHSQQKK